MGRGRRAGGHLGDLTVLAQGATTLRGGTTGYAVSGGRASTTYSLDTGSVATVFAAMPAQSDISGSRLAAAYPSVNGPMPAVTGTSFTTWTPAYDVPVDLDLSTLSAADRSTLTGLVSTDAARVATIDATDSYYAGKQLTRAVQVYRLARQLGLASAAASLKAAVVARLDQWFDPAGCAARSTSCFGYDRVLKGVVGEQPSYGSDTEFNDHYFHYGYLLYAAGAMALDDPALTSRWRTMADTVAADIAAPRSTATTVARRHFDDYAGHGWASGVAPFADGNNQESSSEATNAWVGVTLWGRASGNTDLATQGQWMFSREAASAVAYWLRPAPVAGFTSPMASLVWGGKKDYATWFSGEPSAIVGIQVLPAAPAQLAYLRSVGTAQLGVLADAALGAGISGKPLVDWSVALTSLGDRARAQTAYAQLADGDIDNGNTRSYLYAVLHTSGTLPSPTSTTVSSSPTTTTPTTVTASPTSTAPTSTTVTASPTSTAPTATTTSPTSHHHHNKSGAALDAFSVVPATATTSLTALTLSGAHTSPEANNAATSTIGSTSAQVRSPTSSSPSPQARRAACPVSCRCGSTVPPTRWSPRPRSPPQGAGTSPARCRRTPPRRPACTRSTSRSPRASRPPTPSCGACSSAVADRGQEVELSASRATCAHEAVGGQLQATGGRVAGARVHGAQLTSVGAARKGGGGGGGGGAASPRVETGP